MQQSIRGQAGCSDVVIAALQLYSDKTHVNVKGAAWNITNVV